MRLCRLVVVVQRRSSGLHRSDPHEAWSEDWSDPHEAWSEAWSVCSPPRLLTWRPEGDQLIQDLSDKHLVSPEDLRERRTGLRSPVSLSLHQLT